MVQYKVVGHDVVEHDAVGHYVVSPSEQWQTKAVNITPPSFFIFKFLWGGGHGF